MPHCLSRHHNNHANAILTLTGLLTLSLLLGSCVGPEPCEMNPYDELYVITEEDLGWPLPILPELGDNTQLFRKVKSQINGYYFFYDSKCRLNGNVAIVKTHGALLKSAKKAKQLFNSEALGLVDRQDLTTRFEVDSLGLLAEGTYLKLAIRKDCITYSVEVTGVWISEEAVLKSVFEKIDFFNEDNLHGYPRKWP